jgi:hypothetical protein
MKESLKKLLELDEKKLANAKPNELPEVDLFIKKLQEDYEEIKSVLLVTERRNLEKTLWNEAENDPTMFNQESIDKLLNLIQIMKNKLLLSKNDSSLLSKLSCGLKTVQNENIGSCLRDRLKEIIRTLKLKNYASLEAFINFGREIQKNFCNKSWEDKNEILSFLPLTNYKDTIDLSYLNFINEISVALEEFNFKTKNMKDNFTIDALSDGITVFKKLLYGDDIIKIDDYEPETEDQLKNIVQTRKLIFKRNKAEEFIEIMKNDCIECEKHLSNTILKESSNLPNDNKQFSIYFDLKKSINIDSLTKAISEKKGPFKDYQPISNDLIIASKSYQATKRLHETLISNELSPLEKLKNYKDEYNNKKTNQALKSNPDSIVQSLFKKAGYYLANFFSFGKIKYSLNDVLMSPQQKLDQKVKMKFNEADDFKLLLEL